MKIKTSAPGKLIILGEHAAVYGFPCIVLASDKRIYVEVEEFNGGSDIILAPGVKDIRFVKKTINLFRHKYSVTKKVRIKTYSDFSSTLGLGSSSAATVATIKALCKFYIIPLKKIDVFNLGYKTVLGIQKVGSGADIAASVFEGLIFYAKKGKLIKKLKNNQLPIITAYSGVKADTSELIFYVNKKYKNKKNHVEKIFKKIAELVVAGKKFIEREDFVNAGKIMTENHLLLKDLGVSNSKLDGLVSASLRAGAWGAKLSGAGGGDCMIALVSEPKRNAVNRAIVDGGGQIL